MNTPPPTDAELTQALFRVIAAQGWRGVTATRLAAESGLSASALLARYPSRLGLLRSFADVVMDEVAAGTVPGQGGTPRDRLFDVLMRGLDALAPYKPGLRRLMTEMYTDAVLAGATAPQAAGVIHSDFERGFIRVEVYSVDDLVEHKTEKAIREAGKMRVEGKQYVMRDGDVCHFLFNV